jgi:eukaryotic translation initiation factor 2C
MPLTRQTIDHVGDTVRERLEAWMKERQKKELPRSIIYYRGGVGTGQYDTIKRTEVHSIREAYRKLAESHGLPPSVSIQAVVVVKRHHTRFYPLHEHEGDEHGNRNTHPSTFVDRLFTSPYYQDFYLQSHSGIKGTAKPTHYFVLTDEVPGLTSEKLRDLTHQICYSYARALCAVSYASPTYYADRLCDRGRMYIRD